MHLDEIVPRLLGRPLVDDPFPLYDELRAASPARREPSGMWFLTGYAPCDAWLRDPRVRPDAGHAAAGSGPRAQLLADMFSFDEGGDHARKRGVVAAAFTAAAGAARRHDIDATVERLLDGLDGEVDLDDSFAAALPVEVTSDLLGLPTALRAHCLAWVEAMTSANQPGTMADLAHAADVAAVSMLEVGDDLLARAPRDGQGVLSLIAAAQDAGIIDLDEAIATIVLVMAAGFDTTRYTIVGVIDHLTRDADAWERARSLALAPGGLPDNAVEEMLRHQGPIHGALARVAHTDVALGDVVIPAGEPVVAMVAAANRDPAVFTDPHALVLDRRAKRSLSFGAGPHHCLGAFLARDEIAAAVGGLLRRQPTLEVLAPPQPRGSFNVRGPRGLTVRLT
jgi:cytochrome P450